MVSCSKEGKGIIFLLILNCSSCGAKLDLKENQTNIKCSYCGSCFLLTFSGQEACLRKLDKRISSLNTKIQWFIDSGFKKIIAPMFLVSICLFLIIHFYGRKNPSPSTLKLKNWAPLARPDAPSYAGEFFFPKYKFHPYLEKCLDENEDEWWFAKASGASIRLSWNDPIVIEAIQIKTGPKELCGQQIIESIKWWDLETSSWVIFPNSYFEFNYLEKELFSLTFTPIITNSIVISIRQQTGEWFENRGVSLRQIRILGP